ncbi:MAG: hypothetical protein IPI73_12690 [Betaproteobacteria bacterium]|nr:hypothetical protein [Betaproteobacteria bacterium]
MECWRRTHRCYGLLAPAGTPQAVIQRLHAELLKVLADPAVRLTLTKTQEVVGSTPADFARRSPSLQSGPLAQNGSVAGGGGGGGGGRVARAGRAAAPLRQCQWSGPLGRIALEPAGRGGFALTASLCGPGRQTRQAVRCDARRAAPVRARVCQFHPSRDPAVGPQRGYRAGTSFLRRRAGVEFVRRTACRGGPGAADARCDQALRPAGACRSAKPCDSLRWFQEPLPQHDWGLCAVTAGLADPDRLVARCRFATRWPTH